MAVISNKSVAVAVTKLSPAQKVYWYFKRVIDILVSLFGITVLLLPSVVIAILIKCDSKGSVLFKQDRVGRNGKIFKIYKFRTMEADSGDSITKIGRVLRKTSIDEFPQLINILKGDMSFVGPRPLVPAEGKIHTLRMNNGVYLIRPGLTGLAQVSGRDNITTEVKVELDTEYVNKYGLLTDIKLIFLTIPKAFAGENIVEGTHTNSH